MQDRESDARCEDATAVSRDEALMQGLVSTHTILGVRDGEFVSLIDPPEAVRELAAACRNVGTLAGAGRRREGETDTMLSAPIILYDYPQIAPESPGDLFDGTEIDEILTLRIMTLTDDEKQAMAAVDERARGPRHGPSRSDTSRCSGLHGTIRGLQPLWEIAHHG